MIALAHGMARMQFAVSDKTKLTGRQVLRLAALRSSALEARRNTKFLGKLMRNDDGSMGPEDAECVARAQVREKKAEVRLCDFYGKILERELPLAGMGNAEKMLVLARIADRADGALREAQIKISEIGEGNSQAISSVVKGAIGLALYGAARVSGFAGMMLFGLSGGYLLISGYISARRSDRIKNDGLAELQLACMKIAGELGAAVHEYRYDQKVGEFFSGLLRQLGDSARVL